jgi:abhydrolase domain-containing protein 17
MELASGENAKAANIVVQILLLACTVDQGISQPSGLASLTATSTMGAVVSALAFPAPPKEQSAHLLVARSRDLVRLKTASGVNFPAISIRLGSALSSTPTLIYSHGNAEDVGMSLYYLDRLARICDCHVFAYEYPGYSLAEGEPSEQNCCEAIQAAFQHVTKDMKVRPSTIILFGRSLGTGPTVDLASKTEGLAGCILQSPLESGIRAVLGVFASYALYPIDIFRNYEKVDKIQCPVFIMHGTEDKVVPCANGRALYASLKQRPSHQALAYKPTWIPGVGHNDMPEQECFDSFRKFVMFCQNRAGK